VVDGEVVGYALTMISQKHRQIPALIEMVEQISTFEENNNYLIMGQICVGKPFRGQGVFPLLYQHMNLNFNHIYNGIYTEIDDKNPRSLRAHEKVGFDVIKQYINKAGHKWNLVYWDWNT
jgi:L-amino acid N-acyltransferase YncA